jgi:hypothetical protein
VPVPIATKITIDRSIIAPPRLPCSVALAFPSSSGSHAMLIAMRRASSFVSTFACRASASFSRE